MSVWKSYNDLTSQVPLGGVFSIRYTLIKELVEIVQFTLTWENVIVSNPKGTFEGTFFFQKIERSCKTSIDFYQFIYVFDVDVLVMVLHCSCSFVFFF